ncbi:MAG: hypothetical protein P8Y25_13625 [Chromatiaceae bacterium]
MSGFVTYDTKRFVLTKPEGFTFEPGQGVELTIDRPAWHGKGHPFTPTSRQEDQVLELIIKRYPERHGFMTTSGRYVIRAPASSSRPVPASRLSCRCFAVLRPTGCSRAIACSSATRPRRT